MKKILNIAEILFIVIVSLLIIRAILKGFGLMVWFPALGYLMVYIYAMYQSRIKKDNS